jgi:tetratricopeptide (TPR) repeat protein/serine/threonine protein kinase
MNSTKAELDNIFCDALELSSPAERSAYLKIACADDPELRRRVERLLEAHAEANSFLDAPPVVATSCDLPTASPGSCIGPYKLLEEIGEGGFGIVFMAEQQQPIRRKVAIKVIKPGMDTRQVIARFEAERQALALMDHPNIAKVLEAGTTESNWHTPCTVAGDATKSVPATSAGRPYFVMELVKGIPITEYCDQNQLSLRERLELFIHVCQAVQHAHQKGIIHRDIKPTNVLVTFQDGVPLVKVIDFGIAKAMGQQLTDKTLFTNFAQLIGTPLYMSPEQAALSKIDVDTRSDIYSLGVLLYELLTSTTPFDKERFKEASYDEIRRIIREEEPPSPSTRISTHGRSHLESAASDGPGSQSISQAGPTADPITTYLATIAAQRKSDPKRLSQLFRGELDWIVMKALEKDRNRRYDTASAFAVDVQRYLHDEPVQACPPSAMYRFRKFARRNKTRLAVAASLFLVVALLLASAGFIVGERVTRRAKAAERFDQALEQAVALMNDENWPGAKAAVERAAGLLVGSGGNNVLQQRLEQVQADLAMVEKLEFARLQRTSVKDGHFDLQAADSAYADAFGDYDVSVMAPEPGETARRVRDSAIREPLLAALVDWANLKTDPADKKKLTAILRLADSDPWRQQVFDALDNKDWPRLARMAGQPEALSQPPTRILALGMTLAQTNLPDAVKLLRQAQQRHPDDFWVNHELAYYLRSKMKPPQLDEAIGFYRVAVALRPLSPGVQVNFGLALRDQGRLDESIAAFKEAIRVQPDYAEAHNALGALLCDSKHDYGGAIAEFLEAIHLKPDDAYVHCSLANALVAMAHSEEAIAEYREAIRLKKDFPEAHCNLATALIAKGRHEDAIVEYREAIGTKQNFPEAYNAHHGLGTLLCDKKHDYDGAIAEFKEALRLKPDFADSHYNLGVALDNSGQLDQAITEFREAIRLNKDYAKAYCNLANAHSKNGQLVDAIAEYREVLRLKPDKDVASIAHNNLANALYAKGRLNEAIAEYREAFLLKSDYPEAHNNLGNALRALGREDEAIGEYQKAIRLNKDLPEAHNGLGNSLYTIGRLDEAVAEQREAIRLKRGNPLAHYGLGTALMAKGQLDEAIGELREGIRLNKDYPEAHLNLGNVYMKQGRFRLSAEEYRIAHELGSKSAHWPYPSAQWLRRAERLAQLVEPRLLGLLRGETQPTDNDERLALAFLCQEHKKLYAAAARFYAEALAADSKVSQDVRASHRYNAACAAALAGCGQGEDAKSLGDEERARLRRQARDWLAADLAAWSTLFEQDREKTAPDARQLLQHWLVDSDFAGVRGADALSKLPDAERQPWRKLWADVENTLAMVSQK